MLESHFGFTRTPFAKDLDPSAFFQSAAYQESLARLQYLVQSNGFGCLTGPTGSGKTTLIRALCASQSPHQRTVLYLGNGVQSPRALYQELLRQLGVQPPYRIHDLVREAKEALFSLHRTDRHAIVIVDEAQFLQDSALRELTVLLSYEMDSIPALTLLLSALPDLREHLRLQVHKPLVQRLTLNISLTPLTARETAEHITHHLATAGVTAPLFTEAALELTHESTGGIPRRINAVAQTALLAAAFQKARLVDDRMVTQAVKELELQKG